MTPKVINIQGLALFGAQRAIFNAITQANLARAPKLQRVLGEQVTPAAFFHTICTSRQFGKSVLLTQLMLYYALNTPHLKIMFVSLTYSQAQKVFNEVMLGIKAAKVVSKTNATENSVVFINGTELYFKSVQQPENLRGYSLDYLFVDEAASIKDDIFDTILRPMLAVRGKQCILASTPKGMNYFQTLYRLGQDERQPRYASYKGLSADNPFTNHQEIEDARLKLPANIFSQEYLAEFISDGGHVFTGIEACSVLAQWPPAHGACYAGLDIALTGDYLVLTIMDQHGQVVDVYRDHQQKIETMIAQVGARLQKYNPRLTLVEINGVGGGIYDYIAKTHRSVNPFTTTNQTKTDIIEQLIYDIQNQTLKLPTKTLFPHIISEANDFTFSYSPRTRMITYGAVGGAHDDAIISLALANWARKTGISRGVYKVSVLSRA